MRRFRGVHPGGFTLIEMLVTISIIAILLAILLPALMSARGRMRMLRCSTNQRNLTFEFQLFALNENETGRGNSEGSPSKSRFQIEDFQESQYGVSEFWQTPFVASEVIDPNNPMICPSAPDELRRQKGFPCNDAIAPKVNVTVGLNLRLYRAVIEDKLAPPSACHLSARALEHPYAPLTIEVDAFEAERKGVDPFYIAPPLKDKKGPLAPGQYWFPGKRHGGATIVGFIGGHVLVSRNSQDEPWDWPYQAESP